MRSLPSPLDLVTLGVPRKRVILLSDLIKVLDPEYIPQNEYERVLRWLGYLDRFLCLEIAERLNIDCGLSDGELEKMALKLTS